LVPDYGFPVFKNPEPNNNVSCDSGLKVTARLPSFTQAHVFEGIAAQKSYW
jgi:hypothetical protein